jgi:hypothetical protein
VATYDTYKQVKTFPALLLKGLWPMIAKVKRLSICLDSAREGSISQYGKELDQCAEI